MAHERRSNERRLELPTDRPANRWDFLLAVLRDDRALCGAALIISCLTFGAFVLHVTGYLPALETKAIAATAKEVIP